MKKFKGKPYITFEDVVARHDGDATKAIYDCDDALRKGEYRAYYVNSFGRLEPYTGEKMPDSLAYRMYPDGEEYRQRECVKNLLFFVDESNAFAPDASAQASDAGAAVAAPVVLIPKEIRALELKAVFNYLHRAKYDDMAKAFALDALFSRKRGAIGMLISGNSHGDLSAKRKKVASLIRKAEEKGYRLGE